MGSSTLVLVRKYNKYSPLEYLYLYLSPNTCTCTCTEFLGQYFKVLNVLKVLQNVHKMQQCNT